MAINILNEGKKGPPSNKKSNKSFTIAAVGDICLGGILPKKLLKKPDEMIPDKVKGELEADITFANLECPFSDIGLKKSPEWGVLFAHQQAINILKHGGFNIVSLANNHICDCNYEGMFYTMQLLEANGITYVGVGENLKKARQPTLVRTRDGSTVAFHAYLEQGFSHIKALRFMTAAKNSPGAVPLVEEIVKEDILESKSKYDCVIISIHWSLQDVQWVAPFRRKICKKMMKWGANLIIGHHPHLLQGYDENNSSIVCYSLGNFYFPPFRDIRPHLPAPKTKRWNNKERTSCIFKATFKENKIVSYNIVPIIQEAKQPVLKIPSHRENENIIKQITHFSKTMNSFYYPLFYLIKVELFNYIETFLKNIDIFLKTPGAKEKFLRLLNYTKHLLLKWREALNKQWREK